MSTTRAEHVWQSVEKSKPKMDIRLTLETAEEPMTTREVAESVNRDKSNVGGYLRSMEDDNLVESETIENNAKVWVLTDDDWEPPQYVEQPEYESLPEFMQHHRILTLPLGVVWGLASVWILVASVLGLPIGDWNVVWVATLVGELTIAGVGVVEVNG